MSQAGLLADPAEVRAILISSATARQPITYSETLALLGHDFTRPKMRALCKVLGASIMKPRRSASRSLRCSSCASPTDLPGQGWWVEAAKKHGFTGLWEGPKAKRLITKLQRQAFDYWSSRG